MDTPTEELLLKVARVSSWQKAKAHLITLATTHEENSPKYLELTSIIDELVTYIEEHHLHV